MPVDYALVIGINHYTELSDGGLPALEAAVTDATAFAQWLTSPGGGNVDPANCYLITSNKSPLKPIHDEVDQALTEIINKAMVAPAENDRFYFYFAGHGLGVELDVQNNALCLANWSEIRRRNALSSKDYHELILRFGLFRKVIFIADCCRNRIYNIRPLPATLDLDANNAGPHLGATRFFYAYATQYQDQSFEIEMNPDELRGVFTKLLLEGLNGAAANAAGEIDADSLKKYLDKETPIEAQKHGFKQIPDISHSFNDQNRLVFRKPALVNDLLCKIKVSNNRAGPIDLLDGSAEVIRSFTVNGAREFELRLTKGLYMLKDRASNEDKSFQISILPNKTEEHVEF